MNDWLDRLSGGDRRSIGAADAVASAVLRDPGALPDLLRGLDFPDAVIRMRCADAAEKVSRVRPELFAAHAPALLEAAERAEQQEVRWHLAPILARLALTEAQATRAVAFLRDWLGDPSRIVRVNALQALHDVSRDAPERVPDLPALLAEAIENGPPSLQARARKLARKLARVEDRAVDRPRPSRRR
jgi:hypothetical protein